MAEKWTRIPRHPGIFRRRGRVGWRYRVTYRDVDRKLRTKDFDQLNNAERFHVSVKRSTGGSAPDVGARATTLAEFSEHLMATSPNLRPSTRSLYEMQWRIHLLPSLGARELGALTMADIKEAYAAMLAGGARPPTVRAAHRLLHSALNTAVSEGRISTNPAHGVPLPEHHEREVEPPSLEDTIAIARAVDPRYKALIELLAFTGLRIGEATALRVRDVDVARTRLRVEQNSVEINGKKVVGAPKTAAGRRTVDLPDPLPAALSGHMSEFVNRFDADALIFTNEAGGPVLQSNIRKLVRAAARKAGVSEPRVHDFRHTSASLMVRAGFTIPEVAAALGQSKTSVALRYSHLFESDRPERTAALSALING